MMARMTQVAVEPKVSEDEYIAFERASETKHELINGVIVAMAGGSQAHNAIALNVGGALRAMLKGRPCIAYSSDQRVHCEATGLYTYPDVVVACPPLRSHPKHRDTLVNPQIIVEVLSDSTELYDRGAKFAHYRAIPSLMEYVLVSQHENKVEHYRRIENSQWVLSVHEGDASVAFPTLGLVLPLSEIYDKIDLVREPHP